jgi:ubiquitin-conjugating enzyme E2 J2
MFFTPSGRFEVSKPICTTFTNFHKESWTSGWNVRTMVLATISFMTSEEYGAGSLNNNSLTRINYAKNSMAHNLKNPLFVSLFKKQLGSPALLSIKS